MTTPETPPSPQVTVYPAVLAFVNDLWGQFASTKVTPLALYRRALQTTKLDDQISLDKFARGFVKFYTEHGKLVVDDHLDQLPRDTHIKFEESGKVFIDIQRFLYQGTPDTKTAIRQHLLKIGSILNPTQEMLDALNKRIGVTDLGNSKEALFINSIMKKAKTSMSGVSTDNPMEAVMGLMNSGAIGDMVSGLKGGVDGGNLDMSKLLGVMQGAIGQLKDNMSTTDESATQSNSSGAAAAAAITAPKE